MAENTIENESVLNSSDAMPKAGYDSMNIFVMQSLFIISALL